MLPSGLPWKYYRVRFLRVTFVLVDPIRSYFKELRPNTSSTEVIDWAHFGLPPDSGVVGRLTMWHGRDIEIGNLY